MNHRLITSLVALVASTSMVSAQTTAMEPQDKTKTSSKVELVHQTGRELTGRSDELPLSPEDAQVLRDLSNRNAVAFKAARAAFEARDYVAAEPLLVKALQYGKEKFAGIEIGSRLEKTRLAIHLSEIYLAQGRNEQALRTLLSHPYPENNADYNPTVALAYCRLGSYDLAQQYLQKSRMVKFLDADFKKELPRTGTRSGLEANILFARAYNHNFNAATLPDLKAALELVPGNPFVAYEIARILQDQKRYKEAVPYLEAVGKYGRGSYAEKAKAVAGSITAYYSPEQERLRKQLQQENPALKNNTP